MTQCRLFAGENEFGGSAAAGKPPQSRTKTSRRIGGTLVRRETARWELAEGEDGRALAEVEVVEAGGEGDFVGEAAYAIFRDHSGLHSYALSVGEVDRLALAADARGRRVSSREDALAELAAALLATLVRQSARD
jgi:hypothetical protein